MLVAPLALSDSSLIPPPTLTLVSVLNVTLLVPHVLVWPLLLVLVVKRDGSSLLKPSTDKLDVYLVIQPFVLNVMDPVLPDVPSVRRFQQTLHLHLKKYTMPVSQALVTLFV